jgi:hypothetical protein
MVIFGPSNSGKTHFVCQLLNNLHVVDKPFDQIIFYYEIFNPCYKDLEHMVDFRSGDIELNQKEARNTLIIIDDRMTCKKSMETISKLVTFGRHKSFSIVLLIQDFFFNKMLRTVTLNSNIFIIFRNMRDKLSASTLFSQLSWDTAFLKSIYKNATEGAPHSYLSISLQDIEDYLRFASDIFGKRPTFYIEPDLQLPSEPIEWKLQLKN